MVGMTRESINKQLRAWAARDWVRLEHGAIVVLDAVSLAGACRGRHVFGRRRPGQWAISARGFNNAIANKLLVLIDGRTVYSPLFSGVFWDVQDVVLEDIERIEVISGPGGTLWGANAVNGVINVITQAGVAPRRARCVAATRSSHGGNEAARWGGGSARTAHMRLYALGQDRGSTRRADGCDRADAASKQQAGFRADPEVGRPSSRCRAMSTRAATTPPARWRRSCMGATCSARWDSRFADGSAYRVQAYYDLQARDERSPSATGPRTSTCSSATSPCCPPTTSCSGAPATAAARTPTRQPLRRSSCPTSAADWANVFAQYQRQLGHWQPTAGPSWNATPTPAWEVLPTCARLTARRPGDHLGRHLARRAGAGAAGSRFLLSRPGRPS